MNLEQLYNRKKDLDDAIMNTTNSIHVLHGHLHEVNYQIELMLKEEKDNIAQVDSSKLE